MDPIQCPECGAKPPFVIFHPDFKQNVYKGIRYKRRKCKECENTWAVVELTYDRLEELTTTIEELTETCTELGTELATEKAGRLKDTRIALAAIKPVLQSGAFRTYHPADVKLRENLTKAADLLIHRNSTKVEDK